MRTVKIVGDTSTIKFGDTATDIKLQMFNDGQLINLDATSEATIRVRDDQVYIKSFNATIVDPTEDVVSFKSSNVTNLAPGNYYLEVVRTMEDGTQYVYPDSGFVTLLITQSATTTNGGLITTLTLQELLDQLEQWKKDVTNSVTELNADVSGINLTNTDIKNQLSALEDKVKDILAFQSSQNQVDNSAVGTNLLTSKPWTVNNNSQITDTSYLGEVWHKLTTITAGTGQGYQWVIDDADKVSLLINYPLQLSFNLNSLTVSQMFNIDVHFYDKNGNDLGNSYSIDSIQANAGELIHYDKQVTFDFNHLQNATKISILFYSTNATDVGTVLLNHESAILKFKTNQLKGPNLIDGQPFATNGDTVLSSAKYLDQEWLQMTSTANTMSRGLQWQIDNKDKIFLMATYPVKFKFNIRSSIAQTFNLDLHFYDNNGNDLNNSINIDQIALNAWELLDYKKEFLVDFSHIKDAAKVVLMLYTSGTNDMGIVLINDYNAVLEYNTNKKSNSASSHDYKQLPEVYLNGSTSDMSGTNYVTMQFKYKDNGREVDGFASTKWQGDSSLAFNKKAYRIKTFEDQSLTNAMKFKPCPLWQADNKYNLKAYYTDSLLCRDVVNANIGTDLWATQKNMPDDLVETDDFGFIDGFPVKVFVNNEFVGIYSFNTAKGDYGKNAKAVISGETYSDATAFSALPTGGVKLDGSDFEMISPDNPTDEIKKATNDLITFVSTSSDDDFKTQLDQHIDLESLIDYFIFLNIIENSDAAGKNQTLITWDLQKWYFHPYDLDTTYGIDSNGNITDYSNDLLGLNSHLFTRLNSLFANEIKSRYKELRTWLTPVYVLKMYRDHINLIGESNYEDEFKLWNNPNHDKNTYNFIMLHVYKRFKLLDSLWLQ
ncbi:CotH kinase family protein [Limosilactobacillus reuteri]|uniref:CotH kinase family protein n=1 Tax=Limosilactobacillus reuteri TaxID=1598 RepID=UPI002F26D28A